MNLDKDTFTAVSAGIAAFGVIVTFIKGFFGPFDRINIGFGFPSSNYERGASMDIQNLSEHAIRIRDLGFIKSDKSQFSFLDYETAVQGQDELTKVSKSTLLSREICYACYGHELEYIAAYGYTTTQKYPRIRFTNKVCLIQRLEIRINIYKRFWFGYAYW